MTVIMKYRSVSGSAVFMFQSDHHCPHLPCLRGVGLYNSVSCHSTAAASWFGNCIPEMMKYLRALNGTQTCRYRIWAEIISINIRNGIKEYQGSILIYVNLNISKIFYHFHIIDFWEAPHKDVYVDEGCWIWKVL